MLYDAYEVQRSLLAGASKLAGLGAGWLNNPANPWGYSSMGPLVAASLEVFAHAAAPRGKPEFAIESVHIKGRDVPVHEEILLRKPFGQLKHFYRDRDLGISYCDQSNLHRSLEIGAEVFAAELLFPDRDFVAHMKMMGIREKRCLPKTLVHLKRKTGTTLSYAGLAIKAERLGFAPSHSLTTIKTWRKLEALYDEPVRSFGRMHWPW